jgi:hypothetical protein
MKSTDKKDIKNTILAALSDIECALESDRYEPSERGAGTAPTQTAYDNAEDVIITMTEYLMSNYGVFDVNKAMRDYSFEEILAIINDHNADDFDELKEIDSFSVDNGERKYKYVTTVYEFKNTGRHIAVNEQRSADGEEVIAFTGANETEKKEIKTYEWS